MDFNSFSTSSFVCICYHLYMCKINIKKRFLKLCSVKFTVHILDTTPQSPNTCSPRGWMGWNTPVCLHRCCLAILEHYGYKEGGRGEGGKMIMFQLLNTVKPSAICFFRDAGRWFFKDLRLTTCKVIILTRRTLTGHASTQPSPRGEDLTSSWFFFRK